MKIRKEKLIPYIEYSGDHGITSYRPFNQTGRWKYVTNENEVDVIYIEHKGLFFKRWIHENCIEFKNVKSEEIHECNVT